MEFMRLEPMRPIDQVRIETNWDMKGLNRLSHIIVSYEITGVTSIQFGYIQNQTLFFSQTYGTLNYSSTRVVRLNHESEFVTGISGEVSSSFITSLTFHTNEEKHEVFHMQSRVYGSSKREIHLGINDHREFGGFFGSCFGDRLYSLGLYLKHDLPGVTNIINLKDYV